jgi:hypothetical protein
VATCIIRRSTFGAFLLRTQVFFYTERQTSGLATFNNSKEDSHAGNALAPSTSMELIFCYCLWPVALPAFNGKLKIFTLNSSASGAVLMQSPYFCCFNPALSQLPKIFLTPV